MSNFPPPPVPPPPRSLWKPIGLTLVASLLLSISTCAGGFTIGKGPNGLGSLLLYAGVMFLGLFLLTLFVAAIYFIIWLIQNARSQ